jgi:hypothetical protein
MNGNECRRIDITGQTAKGIEGSNECKGSMTVRKAMAVGIAAKFAGGDRCIER